MTYLNNSFHEIFLSNCILAADHLFKDTWEDVSLVQIEVDTIKLTESHEICPNEDTKLTSLCLAFFMIAGVTLVLQAYPKLVHFNEIGQDKRYRILEATRRATKEQCLLECYHPTYDKLT